MGFGFTVLFHLIILFILSLIIAVISAIVTFIAGRKKRKAFLAFCLPFIFVPVLYFSALIGSIIVSEVKDVDTGIGDAWYAPVNGSCKVGMIDTTDTGYIACSGNVSISGITALQQYSDTVIAGKAADHFFVLNLNNNEVSYYLSEQELTENTGIDGHDFLEIAAFEAVKYRQAAGTPMLMVGIVSLALSILISCIFGKIFFFVIKWRDLFGNRK
ncbi:MAG: hypothetical protein LBL07_01390 [Tannerella sp.]|jgi:hypothetical protein|nr:hypothetical protein [Tannerella sp.]